MKLRYFVFLATLLWATGASAATAQLLTPEESLDDDLSGPSVAWLGQITRILKNGDDTCFVLNRVQPTDVGVYAQTATQFAACSGGGFGEDVFSPGKVLLVEGNLGAAVPRLIDNQELTIHLVAAPALTPQPDYPAGSYRPGYYSNPYPYYDPWYPGYGVGIGLGYRRWHRH